MILGLTGGIASGKSLVASYFKKKGYPLIDADLVSRQVVEPGQAGLQGLVEHFGSDILQADGSLDRKTLGQVVFYETEKREEMNDILLPLIREEILKQLQELQVNHPDLIVLDIPLLYEANYEEVVDQVMVVYVDFETQLRRLMNRNEFSRKEALQRIQAQLPLEKKRARADYVIDNNGSRQETYKQVDDFLESRQ